MKLFTKPGQIRTFILFLLLLGLIVLEAQDVKVMTLLSESELTVSKAEPQKIFNANSAGLVIKGEINGGRSYENTSYLQFDLSNMPENVQIKSMTLRIYLKQAVDPRNKQTVVVYPLDAQQVWSEVSWDNRPDKGKPVNKTKDRISFKKVDPGQNQPGNDFKLNIKDPIISSKMASRGLISLLLAAGEKDCEYYSTGTGQEYNYQPKLIIEYSTNSHLAHGNWGQMKQDPQHSGQQTWESNVVPNAVNATKIIEGTNKFYFTNINPVIYDDQLICAVQQTGTGNVEGYYLHRYALTSNGEFLSPNSPRLQGIVKHQPVVGPKGQLYCIMGETANTLVVYDLKNNFQEKGRITTDSVTATPVTGNDGSVYLSTKKGLYAYTPDFKIKWKYAPLPNLKNHHFGSLALSKDEKRAYVVFGDEGKLVVLDNTDGKVLKSSKKVFSIYDKMDEIKVPVPTVDVQTGKVIVLDGFRTGSQMILFDKNGEVIDTYEECGNSSKCFSQPVITNGSAHFIQNGALRSLDLKTNTTKYLGGTSLNPGSTLVADKNSNVYVLNTISNPAELTIYNKSNGSLAKSSLNGLAGINLRGNRLLLSPDGNLVAGNDNLIALIHPVSFTGDVADVLSINTVPEDQKVYRTRNSIVVGAVEHKTLNNTILYAGKSIGFNPGFRVKSGAKLTCKIIDLKNLSPTTDVNPQDELFDLNGTYYITDAKHDGSIRSSPGGGVYHHKLPYNSPGIVFNWYFMPTGDGYYYIYDLQYNRALIAPDYYDHSSGTSSIYHLAPEGKTIAQWKITPSGIAGKYIITNRKHGNSLVAGDVADNNIYLQSHNNRQNAYWTFTATKEKAPANKPNPNITTTSTTSTSNDKEPWLNNDFVRIQSKYKKNHYLHNQKGTLEVGPIQPDWLSAQWKFVQYGGNTSTGNFQSRTNPKLYLHNNEGKLEIVENPNPQWGTVLWTISPPQDGGWVYITSLSSNMTLHMENGKAEIGGIQKDMSSGLWKVE